MPTDALHAAAVAWNRSLLGPFLTTEYVLVEFANAMAAPARRERAAALLQQIARDENIRVVSAGKEWYSAGYILYESRPDKAWSLTDCISFVAMREVGATLALTYDNHFEQAGFRALLRHAPPS